MQDEILPAESLEHAAASLARAATALRTVPVFSHVMPPLPSLTTQRALTRNRAALLARCASQLAQIGAETQRRVAGLDTAFFSRVTARAAFISQQLARCRRAAAAHAARQALIAKIEDLEKTSAQKAQQLVLSPEASAAAIKRLHEAAPSAGCDPRLARFLRRTVKLSFEKARPARCAAYEAIVALCDSSPL